MGFVVAQLGHLAQAVLAQQAHIDGGCQGHQSLVGADVGGGFLAADVLLAGGQGQHVGALAAVIDRLAHQAAGHLAHIFFAGGKDTQVGTAKGQRDAQRLAFAGDDIGAKLAGGFEQAQGDRVDRDREQRAGLVRSFCQGGVVIDAPEEIGVLDDHQGGVLYRSAG